MEEWGGKDATAWCVVCKWVCVCVSGIFCLACNHVSENSLSDCLTVTLRWNGRKMRGGFFLAKGYCIIYYMYVFLRNRIFDKLNEYFIDTVRSEYFVARGLCIPPYVLIILQRLKLAQYRKEIFYYDAGCAIYAWPIKIDKNKHAIYTSQTYFLRSFDPIDWKFNYYADSDPILVVQAHKTWRQQQTTNFLTFRQLTKNPVSWNFLRTTFSTHRSGTYLLSPSVTPGNVTMSQCPWRMLGFRGLSFLFVPDSHLLLV